ncbi:MAG: hypothetical protein JWO09_1776 [Bacteroidetes bacterium]|nr:hypothetical protein [Bacteroidota bacterium]
MNFKVLISVLTVLAFAKAATAQKAVPKTDFENAYHLYTTHSFKEALNVFANAEKGSEREACGLVIKGFVFTDSISFEKAKHYFEEAEKLLENTADVKVKCKNYFGLGKGYFNTAEFQRSISYFLKMDYAAFKAKLVPEQKSANYYLAMDYQRLNKIAIAGNYIKKAIAMAKEMNDSASVVRCYYVYGTNFTYYGSDDTTTRVYGDSMLDAVKDAEKYVQGNNPGSTGMINDLYTKAYEMKDDPLHCKRYALASLNNCIATADSGNIIACYIILGQVYKELKKFDSALYFSSLAERLKQGQGGLIAEDQRVFNFNMYEIYKALGRPGQALLYLEKWYREDRDLNEEKNINLQQLRENFETQKTNLQIENEKERAKALYEQKRNFYMYISAALFFVFLLIAYLAYYRFKTRKQKKEQELRLLVQHAELTALKAQMNPHFIFNALNSIQHSIVSNNTEDAYRFLSKFSKLIRNVLDSSSEQLVPLKTEIETLSLYVEIESKRFDNSFSFKITLEDNGLPADEIMVPSMILQPFIENAIWHGLMPKEGDKHLDVSFSIRSGTLVVCMIRDNGIGREKAGMIAAQRKKHTSRGISNIFDRIKLLEQTNALKVEIDIVDEADEKGMPAGTRIEVKILNTKHKP